MRPRSQVPSLTGIPLLGSTKHPFLSFNGIRFLGDESFENISRFAPRILNSVPSPSPSHFSSWHVPPSEMGFVLDTSPAGYQTSEQPAYPNSAHDFARHGDHGQGYYFPPSRGYDSRAPVAELPSISPQFSVDPAARDTVDPPIPRSTVYPIIYTDDTTKKLTSRVRRQCFNCKSKATTTWRRSMLMSGKWVCDFCVYGGRKNNVF